MSAKTGSKYVNVETGIYSYISKDGQKTYHERVIIQGKRTWRSLGFNFTTQRSLKLAKEEYWRRRTEVAAGRDPYAEPKPSEESKSISVSYVVNTYVEKGFPDKYIKARSGRMLEIETRNCESLLGYWNGQPWDSLSPKAWREYRDWRVRQVPGFKEGEPATRGLRTVDMERNTLNNAFKYALSEDLVSSNPVTNLPRFQPASGVKHCREFCPQNAAELHEIAKVLFKKRKSEVLAWQLLFEANTGLRTEEILRWRTDAKPGEPGFVRPDGNIDLGRCKKGANPYVFVHEGLRELLKAHSMWKAIRYPNSSWYFPCREASVDKPVHKGALAHRLHRLFGQGKLARKVTSHGMRAWYVLIRRSQGASDAIIAWEIGHTSGGAVIASTYGGVPENWRNGGGPNLKWLPEGDPAWADMEKIKWKRPWQRNPGHLGEEGKA